MAIEVGEILFVDTNVLLTATDEGRAHHAVARRVLAAARRGTFHLAWSGQIMREYLVVATRPPEVNGLGMTTEDALGNIEQFAGRLVFHEETEAVSARLRDLVRSHGVTGKRVHDANVVAVALAHGMSRIVTENTGDFAGFPEVEAVGLAEAERALLTA